MAGDKRLLARERFVLYQLGEDPGLLQQLDELTADHFRGAGNATKFQRVVERAARGDVPHARRRRGTAQLRGWVRELVAARPATTPKPAPPVEKAPVVEIQVAPGPPHQAELDEPEAPPPWQPDDGWQLADETGAETEPEPEPEPIDRLVTLFGSPGDRSAKWARLTPEQQTKLKAAWRVEERETRRAAEADLQAATPTANKVVHIARPTELPPQQRAMRRKQLKKLRWHLAPRLKLDAWIDQMMQQLGGRHPYKVGKADIGAVLRLTLHQRMAIEDKDTTFGQSQGWKGRNGGEYFYRYTTIGVIDKTDAEVQAAYKRKTNAEGNRKRKAERARTFIGERPMHTTTTEQPSNIGTGLLDVQMARTRDQMKALYDAFGDVERTSKDFMAMATVRRHPAWCDVSPDKKLYQTIVTRLDMLEAKGRIKTVRRDPGPRGSRVRVMRRI